MTGMAGGLDARGLGRAALIAGLAATGLLAGLALFVTGPGPALAAWLAATLAVGGVPIGALLILQIHNIIGGRWIRVLERPLLGAVESLPALVAAFVPLLLALGTIFPWADAGTTEAAAHHAEKAAYLNPPFFIGRTLVYLAVLIGLAALTVRGERVERRPAEQRLTGGLSLIALTLVLSFLAVDWILSLDPAFNSTVIGLLFVHGCVLAGFGFAVLAGLGLRDEGRSIAPPGGPTRRSLGALAVAGALLWIYLAVFKFLVIWSADLPHEAAWYLVRVEGPWLAVLVFVVLANGLLPFLLLATEAMRGRAGRVLIVAAAILAARLADSAWLTVPSAAGSGWLPALLTLIALTGLGGLWLALVAWLIRRRTAAATEYEVPQHG